MGFGSTVIVILWLPFITMGTLTVTVYSSLFGLGWVGFLGFLSANLALAYYWNKARKHGVEHAILDDRLSSAKMESAREWWMNRINDEDP